MKKTQASCSQPGDEEYKVLLAGCHTGTVLGWKVLCEGGFSENNSSRF